jgi:mRNA-degrading endonuclease RelE of RelBE toxin-antitoxin system
MNKRIHWSDEARADVRSIDRETALNVLKGVARFVETNVGDVKQLRGFNPPRYRLRVGDWRIAFRKRGDDAIEIISVRNRKDAYR